MKKLALVLLLAPGLLSAQVRSRDAIERDIQTFARGFLPAFTDCQEDYLKQHPGRYWQGLITSDPPVDGERVVPELKRRPAAVPFTWEQFFAQCPRVKPAPPATWPAAAQVDEYVGPQGAGWTLTLTYTSDSKRFRRVYHVGPERSREQREYREVVASPSPR